MSDIVEELLSTQNWEGMARQVDLDLTIDVREEAKRITIPSLIIGSAKDQMVPIANSRELAGLIAGARFHEMDSGHVAPQERPEDLVSLIRDFLQCL